MDRIMEIGPPAQFTINELGLRDTALQRAIQLQAVQGNSLLSTEARVTETLKIAEVFVNWLNDSSEDTEGESDTPGKVYAVPTGWEPCGPVRGMPCDNSLRLPGWPGMNIPHYHPRLSASDQAFRDCQGYWKPRQDQGLSQQHMQENSEVQDWLSGVTRKRRIRDNPQA